MKSLYSLDVAAWHRYRLGSEADNKYWHGEVASVAEDLDFVCRAKHPQTERSNLAGQAGLGRPKEMWLKHFVW